MKILAIADMHGSARAFREMKEKSRQADLIINAGDFSIFEQNIEQFFAKMDKLGKKILLIHGNHEMPEDCKAAAEPFENIIFLHKAEHKIGTYLFLGYGGGGFARNSSSFEKQAAKWKKKIEKLKPAKVILITHAPPYKTKLDKIYSESAGNKSIRKFIDDVKPDLVVTGHLHENSGKQQKLGKTLMINPGPFGKIVNL